MSTCLIREPESNGTGTPDYNPVKSTGVNPAYEGLSTTKIGG